ncbi:hypothetical protein BO86DRAFT_402093 [Aspergillus japonicus CBS 114.51]|uniref:DUF6924 domain-containing protein n=1 Tax=Aspergillus japonicus CBS 114.51 TaxID=1448312 RepID=A0A8T8WTS7_ASPJA|nr:hypothetical protein BO86DRAFT_402093 [Aspergillus japonicus CBS 114.51]RAH79257.1 hypothetical protein BO86DRAFT_402093 [Aspergillus japonicus CBS 114.51]
MCSGTLIPCLLTRNFPHKLDSPIYRISPDLVSHSDRMIWIFRDDEVEVAIFILKSSQVHWLPLLCLVTRRAIASRHHIFNKFLSSAPKSKITASKMELTPSFRQVGLSRLRLRHLRRARGRWLCLPVCGDNTIRMVRFVTETARDTVINPYSVFIADERTVVDQTVLVVGIHDETREIEATVRMVPELLDLLAANLVIANTNITEMKLNAEETGGVYRH